MIYRGRELDVVALWSEYVDLPQVGDPLPTFLPKVKCPNPAHDTYKHHFQINAKKPFVHCFARCGVSGSYEHALCVILGIYDKHGVDDRDIAKGAENVKQAHREARRIVLRHTRTALGRTFSAYEGTGKRKSVAADSAVAQEERLLAGGSFQFLPKAARRYLDIRGIDSNSRSKWQLGWDDESDRLVIPAFDHRGTFRFLIKRSITSQGSLKYLYTPGAIKTSILFGACHMNRERLQSFGMVLVEGSLDTIRMHQLGQDTTGGILGTGLSAKQVRLIYLLNPRRLYLFFDKDSAGVDNIRDAKTKITKLPLYVVRYPKAKNDPAEVTREEVNRQIERAVPIDEFFRKARRRSKLTRKVFA